MHGLAKLAADNNKKLYHLSKHDLNGKLLTPRIPQNYLTENGYEEDKTPRVSFARSIDGALVGLSSNLKGLELFVHEPEDYSKIKRKVITAKEVPDAEHTQEEWVTTPVKLKTVGKIQVGEAAEKPLLYKYGPHTGETYGWNYTHKQK